MPQLLGSRVLGLLGVAAAVAGSVALGRRGTTHRGLVGLGNMGLGLFAVVLLLELGASEAYDDYRPEYASTYSQPSGPISGLRADGREISNIFPFDADGRPLSDVYLIDQDGHPVVATHDGNEMLEATLPLDRDGNEVQHSYPQVQHEPDPGTGLRSPGPTPEFRPPPGPLRSP